MKIVRGLAESLDLINKVWDFEIFANIFVLFVKIWIDSAVQIKVCPRFAGNFTRPEDFCTDI